MTFTPGQLVTYAGACYRVHKLLDDGRLHIIARRRSRFVAGYAKAAPDVLSPWVEPERKHRSNALCQCCGRQIEANAGVIAHHGYARPQGWHCQTASCYGARFPAFQISRDRLGEMIEKAIKPHLERLRAHLDRLHSVSSPPVAGPRVKRAPTDRLYEVKPYHNPPIGHAHPEYAHYRRLAIANTESEVRHTEHELATHQARFDGWKPGKITGGR